MLIFVDLFLKVVIKKDFKYLGIIRANPVEYVQRYGSTLKTSRELPDFVLDIKPPAGVVLAADYQYNQVHELEGDLHALRLIDLEREGLGEYRAQLARLGINYVGAAGLAAEMNALSNVSHSNSQSQSHHYHQYSNHNQFNNNNNNNSNNNCNGNSQPNLLGTHSNVTSSIGMASTSNHVPTGYAHQYAQQVQQQHQQQHQHSYYSSPASPSSIVTSSHQHHHHHHNNPYCHHNNGSGVGQAPVVPYHHSTSPNVYQSRPI